MDHNWIKIDTGERDVFGITRANGSQMHLHLHQNGKRVACCGRSEPTAGAAASSSGAPQPTAAAAALSSGATQPTAGAAASNSAAPLTVVFTQADL